MQSKPLLSGTVLHCDPCTGRGITSKAHRRPPSNMRTVCIIRQALPISIIKLLNSSAEKADNKMIFGRILYLIYRYLVSLKIWYDTRFKGIINYESKCQMIIFDKVGGR
uniref:Uncharacterized protein n=1 Tax=Cacopsylla melanoneura TaxID=428564 RepID=A0A8D8Q0A6_9HEMI